MLTESCPVRIQDPEWICHGLFWCLQVEYCPGCLNKKWDKKIHKFVFNFKFPHELLKFSSVTSDLLAEFSLDSQVRPMRVGAVVCVVVLSWFMLICIWCLSRMTRYTVFEILSLSQNSFVTELIHSILHCTRWSYT